MSVRGDIEEDLALGGVVQETLELLRSPFETDEYRRAHLRLLMRQNALLEQIAINTGGLPTGPVLVGDGDEDDGSSGFAQTQPVYFAADDPITVDNSTFDSEDWDFVARTVVLFFDEEIDIAFLDPSQNEDVTITLTSDKSPFSISGVEGIFTDTLWYKQGPNASASATLDIIAIQ